MPKLLKLIHFWPRYWKTSLLLTDCVVVLRPTRHKIGNFGDVSPSQSFGLVWKKLNLSQQKHTFTNQKTKARFSRPLWQHFQAPYLFSSTFKVLEVLIPNSSIFEDISSTLWTLHYIDRAKYYASSVNKVTTFCNIGSLYLSLRPKSQTLLWDLINVQNVLNHVSDRSSHLIGKCREKISAFSLWQLLYCPKLRHHLWCICFVYICLPVFWYRVVPDKRPLNGSVCVTFA